MPGIEIIYPSIYYRIIKRCLHTHILYDTKYYRLFLTPKFYLFRTAVLGQPVPAVRRSAGLLPARAQLRRGPAPRRPTLPALRRRRWRPRLRLRSLAPTTRSTTGPGIQTGWPARTTTNAQNGKEYSRISQCANADSISTLRSK